MPVPIDKIELGIHVVNFIHRNYFRCLMLKLISGKKRTFSTDLPVT